MKDQIRQLIGEGKLKEALKLIQPYAPDEVLILLGRLARVERENNMGLLKYDDYALKINQITRSMVELAQLLGVQAQENPSLAGSLAAGEAVEAVEPAKPGAAVENRILSTDIAGIWAYVVPLFAADKTRLQEVLTHKMGYELEMASEGFVSAQGIKKIKAEIVRLYKEMLHEAALNKTSNLMEDLDAIMATLKTEPFGDEELEAALDAMILFFMDNPEFRGIRDMEDLKDETQSPRIQLRRKAQPARHQAWVNSQREFLRRVAADLISKVEKQLPG